MLRQARNPHQRRRAQHMLSAGCGMRDRRAAAAHKSACVLSFVSAVRLSLSECPRVFAGGDSDKLARTFPRA